MRNDFLDASFDFNPNWDALALDKKLDLVYLHSNFAEIYKGHPDILVGNNLSFLAPREIPQIADVFNKDGFNNISFEFYNAADEYVHLMLNGFCIEKRGVVLALVFWNDITKYSTYEKKYLTKEIELNTLIYKISHDLRGPVATSKGLINLIKIENPDKAFAQYLDLLEASILKLDNSIVELGKMADLAAGNQYYFSHVDMHELLYKTLSDLSKNYDVYDMIFDFKLDRELTFKTYQFALASILSHLLIFSIENKQHNTKLFLNLKIQLVDKMLFITTSDNGIGIVENDIDNVFSPFFRVSESYDTSTLSLFTIKKSIDFLNGEIKVHSRYGEGTEFSIKIAVS